MIIVSHHRNAALAARHLAALRREYDFAELLSRRNADGHYSRTGHTFTFEVRNYEQPEIELVLHFDYESENDRNLLRFQVHVTGPADATDEEAIRIIRESFRAHEPKALPKGWRRKAIYWGHVQPDDDSDVEKTGTIDPGLRRSAILAGKGAIAQRRPIRSNRRAAKRKAAK